MFEAFPEVARANPQLLAAIGAPDLASAKDLAERGGVRPDNLNRKLEGFKAEGLIDWPEGTATHKVTLSAAGERALAAMRVFSGEAPADAAGPLLVDPNLVDDNRYQPRFVEDPDADAEMVESVRDKGVLQAVWVRKTGDRYEQAFGHRRKRGALGAGALLPIIVKDLSDDDMLELAGIENLQRNSLHWVDEAIYYLALAEGVGADDASRRRRSAAEIQRLVGVQGRKKRSIQDMIQLARELDDDAKRRARLPDGDRDRLTVEQCRAMVGNKKTRPTVELTTKLSLALLELLIAAKTKQGSPQPVVEGDTLTTVLHRRPVGGPLITLSDRSLIRFKIEGGGVQVVTPITADLAKHLLEIGYNADPFGTVEKARAAVVGELAATAGTRDGRYLTPELNPPERAETTSLLTDEEADADTCPECGADIGTVTEGCATCAELEDGGAFAFGEKTPPAAAAAKPAEDLPDVSDDKALILFELADKIGMDTASATNTGPLSAKVDPSYRSDPLTNELVMDRLLMFQVKTDGPCAALTAKAFTWLAAQGIEKDFRGCAVIDTATLQARQQGRPTHGDSDYCTPWLTLQPAAPAHAVRPAGVPQRDGFMQQVLDSQAEDDAGEPVEFRDTTTTWVPLPDISDLTRLLAATREAHRLIEATRNRKLTPAAADPILALVGHAIGDAERLVARLTAPAPALDA